jgi:hypothetical protein
MGYTFHRCYPFVYALDNASSRRCIDRVPRERFTLVTLRWPLVTPRRVTPLVDSFAIHRLLNYLHTQALKTF